jgi:hypothetical protein
VAVTELMNSAQIVQNIRTVGRGIIQKQGASVRGLAIGSAVRCPESSLVERCKAAEALSDSLAGTCIYKDGNTKHQPITTAACGAYKS